MNQLVLGNLIERKKLLSDEKVLNYLTAEGCRVLGYEVKKKRVPKVGRFEHDKGVLESYLWLVVRGVRFGQIVTEKALNSSIELVKDDSGWVRVGLKEVHLPDGYYKKIATGEIVAIEYERTRKGKTSNTKMLANVERNSRRFHLQFWFVELPSIKAELQKSQAYKQGTLKIFNMDVVRAELAKMMEQLPTVLSGKSAKDGGAPRVANVRFSEPIEAVSVAKLPLLANQKPVTAPATQQKPVAQKKLNPSFEKTNRD